MDDKPQDRDENAKTAGAGLRGHHRRPDGTPENFIAAAQRKLGEAAGELTNNLVGAAAHVDIAHKFADPITPALAKQYVKGRAIVEERRASGIAPDNTSGLSGADAAAVIAYQKVHDTLPAQIPLIDKATLLRHAETIIEQKAAKSAPQPEVPRAAKPARVSSETQTPKHDDTEAKRAVSRMAEAKPAAPGVKAEKPQPVVARPAENRPQATNRPEQKQEIKPEQKLALKPDQKPDAKAEQVITPKIEQRDMESTGRSELHTDLQARTKSRQDPFKDGPSRVLEPREEKQSRSVESTAKMPPKPHEPASPVLKDRAGSRMVAPAQKAEPERKVTTDTRIDSKRPMTVALVKEAPAVVFRPIVESRFYKSLISPAVSTLAFSRDLPSEPNRGPANQAYKKAFTKGFTEAPAKASAMASGEAKALMPLAPPITRQIALATKFSQPNIARVAKPADSHTSHIEKPAIINVPRTGADLRPQNVFEHHAERSAEHREEHLPDTSSVHLVGHSSEHTLEHQPEHVGEHLPEYFTDHLTEILTEHPSESRLPDSSRPMRFTLKGATDKDESGDKYITGTEFAFVAIMALASTARAKPGPNMAEVGLRQAHRQFTMVEENFWPITILPAPEAVLDDSRVYRQRQIKEAPPAKPARAAAQSVKVQTVTRPQIVAQIGDDLSEMAALLFHDERLGHLIADLNADRTTQTYEQNARVVVIRTRQKLTLPAYQDIENYGQQLIKIGEIPLITIVETSTVDEELLAESLSPMLGINSPNRDPLQG